MTNNILHVLLIDDEDSFRLGIEMALKMTGAFVVESCDSGERGIELMHEKSYDVILLDYRMPAMSGMDVLEWMHKNKVHAPVIIVTAAASEATAVEALKMGVYDFIRKDQLNIDRLSIAIQSVHERYLYRKQIIEREAEERLLREKQKELDALQVFHTTVNTVGQLVETSLVEFLGNLKKYEEEMLRVVREGKEGQCRTIFSQLKQGMELVSSGVSSMRNLSTVVTRRLEDIKIAP